MKDLYEYVNISNIPLEKRIELSIIETKKELGNLTTERTCKIYSRYLFKNLHENHVMAKIINTNDLEAEYEHYFILVPVNIMEYYLIDLTYPQFKNNELFKDLYEKGYEKITDLNFYLYYAIVTGEQSKITLSDTFLNKSRTR